MLCRRAPIGVPAGENVAGKDYMEFYLDEETLDDMIIGLFYDEKK